MRLKVGGQIPNFTFDTPFEEGKELYKEANGKPLFLMFLRYYGCTICQLDIRRLQQNYGKFLEKGAKVLVVLQSKPETIAAEQKPGDLPFDIVCDPDQALYKEFEIAPAKSTLAMASLGLVKKMKEAKAEGLEHGVYEGNEQQLPALFLMNGESIVQYAHYAKNLADMPSLDEMLALLPS